jgi:hypothetical protein
VENARFDPLDLTESRRDFHIGDIDSTMLQSTSADENSFFSPAGRLLIDSNTNRPVPFSSAVISIL